MKTAPFEYHAPRTVDEVARRCSREHGDEAKVLAGGQSLVPLLAMRLARPDAARRHQRGRRARVHPSAGRKRRRVRHAHPRARGRALAARRRAAAGAGRGAAVDRPRVDPQPRHHRRVHRPRRRLGRAARGRGHHRRRDGGALLSRRTGRPGRRLLRRPLHHVDDRRRAAHRGPDTVRARPTAGWAFYEVARRHGDFALVGVAAMVSLDGDRIGDSAHRADRRRRPCRARARRRGRTRRPAGRPSTRSLPRRDEAIKDLEPASDIHGSAEFRRHLAGSRHAPRPDHSRRAAQEKAHEQDDRDRRERRAARAPRPTCAITLADFLREKLGLTGTHLGCEHGVCGACTVIVDGVAVRSCLMLAVQARGKDVLTVEGLGDPDQLHPLQQAFRESHAFQCGFCTPGFVMASLALLPREPVSPTRPRSVRCSRATSAAAPVTRASSKGVLLAAERDAGRADVDVP